MAAQNNRLGIKLMIATMLVFAAQDGLSRHLADIYSAPLIVMYRYWFFALFVLWLARRKGGSISAVARTSQPFLQCFRGVLLAVQICFMVIAFMNLGLVDSHAVFACYPLLVAALSVPFLRERVGLWRWAAILLGFIGIMIILAPGRGSFSVYAIIPLISALMFASYALLTRFAARRDDALTSFFWTGIAGCGAVTCIGIFFMEPMAGSDVVLMGALCLTGVTGHWLLIKCYEVADASAVQPFAFLQLPAASIIGVLVFGDLLKLNVVIGAAIVLLAGLFTLWRERKQT